MTQIIGFLAEVSSELKKVSWPSKEETIKMTAIVIIATIIIGVYVGGVDFSLTKVLEQFLK